MVESGRYPSFDAAVEAALERLITASERVRVDGRRAGGAARGRRGRVESPLAAPSPLPRLDDLPDGIAQISSAPPVPQEWRLLPFTVSRLFPLKSTLRIVASGALSPDRASLTLREVREQVGRLALGWRVWLDDLDVLTRRGRGVRLGTGFPAADRAESKSLARFLDSFVGLSRASGRVAGVPFFLRFLGSGSGSGVPLGTDPVVALTREGTDFVRIRNPVADDGRNQSPPFSTEEAGFLVSHLAKSVPLEAEHLRQYLSYLRDNPGARPADVSNALRGFYVTVWPPLQVTSILVNSMRVAVHSRAAELGFVGTRYAGKAASYELTELGHHVVDTLPGSRYK